MSLSTLLSEVAEMRRAVRVRRTVVQHEARPAARDVANLLRRGPWLSHVGEHLRLALREIGLHGKAGLGKIDRALVVSHCRLLPLTANVRMLPRLGRVLVHLLHQRVEVRELLLVADLRDELHFQLASVERAANNRIHAPRAAARCHSPWAGTRGSRRRHAACAHARHRRRARAPRRCR